MVAWGDCLRVADWAACILKICRQGTGVHHTMYSGATCTVLATLSLFQLRHSPRLQLLWKTRGILFWALVVCMHARMRGPSWLQVMDQIEGVRGQQLPWEGTALTPENRTMLGIF